MRLIQLLALVTIMVIALKKKSVAKIKPSCTQYCDSANTEYGYACSLGTTYHGRGPIQFTWNYNYGAMSEVLYGNNNYTLLENPSILVTDAVISYRSALWFWMTVQAPKPSAHDVMIGNYSAEASKNRYPGFGMTIKHHQRWPRMRH